MESGTKDYPVRPSSSQAAPGRDGPHYLGPTEEPRALPRPEPGRQPQARPRGLRLPLPLAEGTSPAPHGSRRTRFNTKLTKTKHGPNGTRAPRAGISAVPFTEPVIKRARERDIPPSGSRRQPERSGETSRAGEFGRAPGHGAVPGSRPDPSPIPPGQHGPAPPPPAHLRRALPPARAPRRPAPAALLAGCHPHACRHWASRSLFRFFIGQSLCPSVQRNWE